MDWEAFGWGVVVAIFLWGLYFAVTPKGWNNPDIDPRSWL